MSRIRVLIADDHAVVRAGIGNLLAGQPDLEITAQAGSTEELQEKALQTTPDVILLDLSMPSTGGLQAIQHLQKLGLTSRFVVLTMHDDPSMIRAALAAGASGYLVKSAEFSEVGAAIRAVHKGRSYLGVSLHDRHLPEVDLRGAPISSTAAPGKTPLSRRELEVLRLLAFGYTYRSMAAQLRISEKSVETYRSRISEKLGLRNRADLVRYALATGVLEDARLGTITELSGSLLTPSPVICGINPADLPESLVDNGLMQIHDEDEGTPPFQEEVFARHLRTVFQPILETGGTHRLFALECLSRGQAGSVLEPAHRLFSWVRANHREEVADRICIDCALCRARDLPGMPQLSLNVHARTISSGGFLEDLLAITERLDFAPSRLILEIVEHGGTLEAPDLLRKLDRIRAMGVRLAVDDFGLGQSNFQRLIECRPDFLKIERYFVENWKSDYRKNAVIESLSRLARRLGTQTIVEGIETSAQLELVKNHGIEFVQGYFFSPPVGREELVKSGVLQTIGSTGPSAGPAIEEGNRNLRGIAS